MSAHSSVRKQRTDKEYVTRIQKRGDTQDTYSSVKVPPPKNLSSDLDSEEYDSIHQSADDLMADPFPETPTKQDIHSLQSQIRDFINRQMDFTTNLTASNRNLRKDYADLASESPRLTQIEHDLQANSQSLRELNAKGRELEAFSDQRISEMEQKIGQLATDLKNLRHKVGDLSEDFEGLSFHFSRQDQNLKDITKKVNYQGQEFQHLKDKVEDHHIKLNVEKFPDGLKKSINPWLHIDNLDSENYPLLKTNDRQNHFSKFCDSLKGIELKDDNLVSLRTFYKSIDTAIMTALNSNTALPPFKEFKPHMILKNHFVTPPTHPHHIITVNAYNKYADTLATFLHQNTAISQESAPRAYLSLQEKQMSSDGFVILSHIITRGCPHLGGIGLDLYTLVDQLKFNEGESLISFYQSALTIITEIQLQDDETGQESRLIRRFIELLYKVPQYSHLLREDYRAITQFFRQKHNHKLQFSRTLSDIYEDLTIYEPSLLNLSTSPSDNVNPPVVAQTKNEIIPDHICSAARITKPEVHKPTNSYNKQSQSATPYKKRPDNDIRCDACGCTTRELVKMVYNNHQDCKKCLLRGTAFIPDKNSRECIKQYNLAHPNDTPTHSTNKVSRAGSPLSPSLPNRVNSQTAAPILEFNDPNLLSDDEEFVEIEDQNLDERDELIFTDETIDEIISPHVHTIRTPVLHSDILTCPIINSMKTSTLKITTPAELRKLQVKIQSMPFKIFSTLQTSVKMMVDGGANSHVLNDASLFISLTLEDKTLIMANNTPSLTKGAGIAIVRLPGSEHLIPLFPCVYAPDHPSNTLSPPALKKYNHYRSVQIEALAWVRFIDNVGKFKTRVPTLPQEHSEEALDYIALDFVTSDFSTISDNYENSTDLVPTRKCNHSFTKSYTMDWLQIHRRLDHASLSTMKAMVRANTLDDLPKTIPMKYQILIRECHVCCKGKFHNLPRTIKTTIFNLRLGELMHIDFYFINIESIRHFTSVLLIVDAKS